MAHLSVDPRLRAAVIPWQVLSSDLNAHERLLVAVLAYFGEVAFPSQGTLSGMMGCSKATVKRAVANLEQRGWLVVERNRKRQNGSKTSNRYNLTLPPRVNLTPPPRVNLTPPPRVNLTPPSVQSEPTIIDPKNTIQEEEVLSCASPEEAPRNPRLVSEETFLNNFDQTYRGLPWNHEGVGVDFRNYGRARRELRAKVRHFGGEDWEKGNSVMERLAKRYFQNSVDKGYRVSWGGFISLMDVLYQQEFGG